MNKTQQAIYDYYIDHLGITTEGEKFILKHILYLDQHRQIALLSIDKIKTDSSGLIIVKSRTISHSYSFAISDINSASFIEGLTQYQKEAYVLGDLHRKMSA